MQKPPTEDKPLTPKQMKFVKAAVQTLNLTKAAQIAYGPTDYGTAQNMGSVTFNKPNVKKAFKEELVKESLSEEWVLKGFKEHAEQKSDKNVSLRAYELTAKWLGMLKEVKVNKTDGQKQPTTITECKETINRSLDELNRLQAEYGDEITVLPGSGDIGVRDSAEGTARESMSVSPDVEEIKEVGALAARLAEDLVGNDQPVDLGDTTKS